MPKLTAFNSVTLDGYFVDAQGDMSWAHGPQDAEFDAFVADNAKGSGRLVFGRVTYEMMAGYWTTPQAAQAMPVVAAQMNATPKLVFSRTLGKVAWHNTTLLKSDLAAEIRKRKNEPGADMAILGSGSLVSQLAREGLIDELQLVLCPIALGKGRTLFDGVGKTLAWKHIRTRTFGNGKVFVAYAPA